MNSAEFQTHPMYSEMTQTFPSSFFLVKCDCELSKTFFIAACKNFIFRK